MRPHLQDHKSIAEQPPPHPSYATIHFSTQDYFADHHQHSHSLPPMPFDTINEHPFPPSAVPTAQHKPLGLGSSTLPHQPLGTVPRGARGLRRTWTTAKPRGDVSCNVLPFFLDLSLAFAPGMQFFDAVRSSVDSEVVFQATLQVWALHKSLLSSHRRYHHSQYMGMGVWGLLASNCF
jgi:hypothetical protein